MRVSYEWLKDMVELPANPNDLVAELVRTGTEVEGVEKAGAELDKIVTGQILEKEAHPDSDHLWVTKVDVGSYNTDEAGEPEPLQIVCGAQNFSAGDHVVVSLVGAVLPGGIKIKKSKLRGVESCGMNCSERELGLGDNHEGIMILPEDAPIGVPFAEWYGLTDTVICCELTPNRPDCLSMEGFAVEVGALLDADISIERPSIEREIGEDASSYVDIEIADTELCQRYVGRVVRNVKIGPSPDWLAKRVTAAGARPINNVVDVTNYVMFLTGQPLHAFDLGKLTERDGKRHVVVRAAQDGEKITTLDGVERTLTSDMALITDDGDRAIALAGVMGGLNSDIDESTVDVLLESARFDPGHTSRTSRGLDLISEASIRFERKVDATRCADVADVAAALFEQCCGAEVCPGRVDVYPQPVEPQTVELRPDRVRAICGDDIPTQDMVRFLTRLGCKVDAKDGAAELLSVEVPTTRPDLEREIDLIEEVLRLWGMDRVEPTLPAAKNHAGGLTENQRRLRQICQIMRACGLSETTTYNFADASDLERLGMSEEGLGTAVQIINPLVSDQSQMRRSMLPGLLRSVAYNKDHGVQSVALYELGRVFIGHPKQSQPEEPSYLAGVLSGSFGEPGWDSPAREADFFDAKFVIEELLRTLHVNKVRFRVPGEDEYSWLQPGRAAEVIAGGDAIGWVGNVHPQALANFEISGSVVAFELSVVKLLELCNSDIAYQDVPTLPGVDMDLALVVDEDVSAEMLVQRIRSAGGKLLDSVHLFDVYRDKKRVGAGKKSMAFSLTYRAADHTLSSEEAEKVHNKVVTKVCKATGAEVRG